MPNPNDDWAASGPGTPTLPVGVILPPKIHRPQFPAKDARTLFTAAEIQQARANVATFPAARAVADKIIQEANYWAEWTDEALRNVVPGAEVPRAFECCPEGCPIHGKKIFEATGTFYPWIVDPQHPFQVKCPIGGETYPSNDYGKFYRSGFEDRTDFHGPYVDDGRGWVGPNGARYWFVAAANHWLWMEHTSAPHASVKGGLAALGRAYLLTGEAKYAHKAAVLLTRIAEVYPNMDHESQSRYGQLLAEKDGSRYTGKIVNAIWETYLVAQFAETYDAVWETIPGDTALQKLFGQTARQICSQIEGGILEEGIDAYFEKKSRGNYGMHQRSLLMLAIVRQHADNPRYLASVLDQRTGAVYLGLSTALNTLVWRDGQPDESPGYNEHWVQNISAMVELLPKLGVDSSTLPRLRRLYDAPLASIAIGRHTPAIGDTTGIYGGVVGGDASVYQQAYRLYGDVRYAEFLAGLKASGADGFKDFTSLLHPPIAAASPPTGGRSVAPQPSRLLSGFGLGLLNNAADDTAASIYFGQHVNHAHYDRLQLDLFAHGQPMMPDLGYPDAMNEYVPGIFTWSLHTISHNTVTVDATPQPGNRPGVVQVMAEGAGARVLDVSAPGTYPQCETYRRALVMVDVGAGQNYFVDFFVVAGGRQHDYSLHGPPGKFVLTGGTWTPPAKGTLAGEKVGLDEIYDDPVLGAPGYKGGYADYRGSGFQHFTAVQRHEAGEWTVDYTHEKDPAAKLRMRVLEQPGQTVMVADARVTPVKLPQVLKYILARRLAVPGEKFVSAFVTVLEPYSDQPALRTVTRQEIALGTAVIAVRADGKTDIVIHGLTDETKPFIAAGHKFQVHAQTMVATFAESGQLERLFFAGGSAVEIDTQVYHAPTRAVGRVTKIDPLKAEVTVFLNDDNFINAPDAAAMVGRVVRFSSPAGATAHTVIAAHYSPEGLVLSTKDDLLVGQMRVSAVKGKTLETQARLVFSQSYAGATALDANFQRIGLVASADQDRLILVAAPVSDQELNGRDVWLSSVGPGDRLEVPYVYGWQRQT
ncbi:MAG: heparinase II/III family protein [Opitutaceae bacterium]